MAGDGTTGMARGKEKIMQEKGDDDAAGSSPLTTKARLAAPQMSLVSPHALLTTRNKSD